MFSVVVTEQVFAVQLRKLRLPYVGYTIDDTEVGNSRK